jgi:DNA-directed RNA polymerase specialized sigma subunit
MPHPKALSDEQRARVDRQEYLDAALKIAAIKARRYPYFAEEIQTAAMIGICDAARTYNGEGHLEGFVRQCVRWQIGRDFRRFLRPKHVPGPRARYGEPRDFIDPNADDPSDSCLGDFLWEILRDLPGIEAAIVFAVIVEGESKQTIGNRLGLGRMSAHRLYAKALGRIRNHPSLLTP